MKICVLISLNLLLLGLRTGYIRISPWRLWTYMLRGFLGKRIGIFTNRPDVLPGRWGFYILGFEVGSRNPRNRIGVWLKAHGFYPW